MLASDVPANTVKSVLDIWNSFHSVPVREEDRDKLTELESKFGERIKILEEKMEESELAEPVQQQIEKIVKHEVKNVQRPSSYQPAPPVQDEWKIGSLGWNLTDKEIISRGKEILDRAGIESEPIACYALRRCCIVRSELRAHYQA